MDAQKADMFIMSNSKYFESYDLPFIREKLLELDEDKAGVMSMIQFKDPTTILIVSILAGSLCLDRFMIGDTGVGIGKLVTCGGFGIWSIVDWFLIQAATREKNKQKMFMMLGGIQV